MISARCSDSDLYIHLIYLHNLLLLLVEYNNKYNQTGKISDLGLFKQNKHLTCELTDDGLIKIHIWREVL